MKEFSLVWLFSIALLIGITIGWICGQKKLLKSHRVYLYKSEVSEGGRLAVFDSDFEDSAEMNCEIVAKAHEKIYGVNLICSSMR